MSAEIQTALWGAATFLPVGLNLLGKRESDALGLSVMIVLIWVLGRVFWAFYPIPDCVNLYPVIDGLAAITCFTAFASRRATWKAVLGSLFLAQLALHTAYAIAYVRDPGIPIFYRYIGENNIIYALELFCAAWPGGQHVGARDLFRRLSHRLPGVHSARHPERRAWR